jgi:hypothetical protein
MAETLSLEYVQTHRTKQQSRGWKIVCPSCGGNDLWYTDDNGQAFCFECGITYRVADGTKRDEFREDRISVSYDVPGIRTLYAELHTAYHESLTGEHRDYLHNRGIDDSAIEQFSIGYCPPTHMKSYESPLAKDAGLVSYSGAPTLSDRIVFPYIADSAVTDMRGRAVHNEEPKYRSLNHRSYNRGAIYPFNYERAMAMAREQKMVILTEGEIKAIVSDMHGFPTVALPGMLAWKPGFIYSPDTKVVVAFDANADPEDRRRVDKALANVEKRVPRFYVVSMPLLGEQKMDIDYFLLHARGGYSRFKYLVDNAVEYEQYKSLRRF